MRYVVVYDIAEDKTRTDVAKVLERYGRRVQKSVFECPVAGTDLDELTAALRRQLKDPKDGNIRVYRLCLDCYEKSFGFGSVVDVSGSEPCIIA